MASDPPDAGPAAAEPEEPPLSHPGSPRHETLAEIIALAMLNTMPPVSVELLAPALPAIAAHFSCTIAAAQATVSLMQIGSATCALPAGFLTDAFGRGHVLTGALLLYVTAAAATTAVTTSLWQLHALCVGLGAGSAVMGIASFALMPDLYKDEIVRQRALGSMLSLRQLGAMAAPSVGAQLQAAFGWQACVAALAAMGVVTAALCAWTLGRALRPAAGATAPSADDGDPGPGGAGKAFRTLLTDGALLATVFTAAVQVATLFVFATGSAYAFLGFFGVHVHTYSLLMAVCMVGTAGGAKLSPAVARVPALGQHGTQRLGLAAALVAYASAALLYGLSDARGISWVPLASLLTLAQIARGIVAVQTQGFIVQRHPSLAATAVGLAFACQQLVSSAAVYALGVMYDALGATSQAMMAGSPVVLAFELVLLQAASIACSELGLRLSVHADDDERRQAAVCARWRCGHHRDDDDHHHHRDHRHHHELLS